MYNVHMKTPVAPTPKLPYSAPLGGNPQPWALNDSPVHTIYKHSNANVQNFYCQLYILQSRTKFRLHVLYVPNQTAVASNLELISFTTGYGNTHNNSIHINSSSADTQIEE